MHPHPANTPQLPPRILALDVGNRRIGVALSDPLGITAQPLLTIHRTAERADLRSVARLVRRHNVAEIVVGDPLHVSGESSAQGAKVRRFAEHLRTLVNLPVHLLDERYTTADAHALLDQTRRRVTSRSDRRRRETIVDQVAAVLLLESFLSAREPRLLPPPAEL